MFSSMAARIQTCMQGDIRLNRTALEKGLYILSRLYGSGIRLRNKGFEQGVLPEYRLPCRVISVGNLTIGGSGKTPMTMFLAQHLKEAGYSTAVISRGYKGKMEKSGGVVSDGINVLAGPDQAGDEPFMMASQVRHVPFLVGADRYKIGKTAVASFDPDVIILDDAFQHRRLYRDIDFVMVDATVGFGNGFLLPRGIMREPKSALGRADAIVMTRSNNPDPALAAEMSETVPYTPVFRSVNRPFLYGHISANEKMVMNRAAPGVFGSLDVLQNARVIGFSGIARTTEFSRMVAENSGQLVDFIEFPDHYTYTSADWHRIYKSAKDFSVDYVVTTQKDYARIPAEFKSPVNLIVIGVQMDFGGDREALINYVETFLDVSLTGHHKGVS